MRKVITNFAGALAVIPIVRIPRFLKKLVRMPVARFCALIDNDIRHHRGQNVVEPSESITNFDHCDDEHRC